jgi:hypothetical protein
MINPFLSMTHNVGVISDNSSFQMKNHFRLSVTKHKVGFAKGSFEIALFHKDEMCTSLLGTDPNKLDDDVIPYLLHFQVKQYMNDVQKIDLIPLGCE